MVSRKNNRAILPVRTRMVSTKSVFFNWGRRAHKHRTDKRMFSIHVYVQNDGKGIYILSKLHYIILKNGFMPGITVTNFKMSKLLYLLQRVSRSPATDLERPQLRRLAPSSDRPHAMPSLLSLHGPWWGPGFGELHRSHSQYFRPRCGLHRRRRRPSWRSA
jgi:hypothetical protein